MNGKTCLITGATSGIGLVTAQALATQGARVVIAGRNEQRARETVAAIQRASGNQQVSYLLADLSLQAQVRHLAGEFLAAHDRLDVLVNNAGAMFWRRHETADGLEMTFAVNHLAPFLLTNLLLDRLKSSAPARIVTVASMAHLGARLNFDDLQQRTHRYRAFTVYSQSKLANILFTYELARRLEGSGVTANTLHPGFVATRFATSRNPLLTGMMLLTRPFSISPERGAETSIYLATSPAVAGVSGRYYIKSAPAQSSAASYDAESARKLWEISAQLTGLDHTV